jgi:hypothetical protein
VEDAELRARFGKWAADHIRAIHPSVRTPVAEGGLDPFGKRIFIGNILKELEDEVSVVESNSEDDKWRVETIGYVLIKD